MWLLWWTGCRHCRRLMPNVRTSRGRQHFACTTTIAICILYPNMYSTPQFTLANRSTALCLACSASLPPKNNDIHITNCCGRPICPTCIGNNSRLIAARPGRVPNRCRACRAGLTTHREQAPRDLLRVVHLSERAQLVLEPPEGIRLHPAGPARRHMGVRPVKFRAAQLAVDEGGQHVSEVAHRSRTRLSRCASAARNWARPRWMRLRTVPSFTPMVAAISS